MDFQLDSRKLFSGSQDQKYFIYNHLAFKVKYHHDPDANTARVVGFELLPQSIKHGEWEDIIKSSTCMPSTQTELGVLPQEIDANKDIVFSYNVSFESSDIKWTSRWDTYLLMKDDQIHWFPIINSLLIVLFFAGIVAMIMMRTVCKDIVKYNQLDKKEELDVTGWKLVHADVFRPPYNYSLLCVYVGTGVQILGTTFVTITFAMLGFLSPSNLGVMVFLWVFMGLFAGYSSSYLYKMFKGSEYMKIPIKTAIMFPSVIFTVYVILNGLISAEKSAEAIPFKTLFVLSLLWFGISVPLVFLGSFWGQKTPSLDDPVKTNKISRPIPPQPWYIHPIFAMLLGGVLPCGVVFVELSFIVTSVWLNQFYFISGFLLLAFVILLITCAEVTIVLCYIQLCCEDYRWWWRAYLNSGASALNLFGYSILYFCTNLEMKLVTSILYLGYMFVISYVLFFLTGAIGFGSCLWFVRKIYSFDKNQDQLV